MIAFVKDTLIYLVIIVAIIYLPVEVRRLGRTSSARPRTKMATTNPVDRQADRRRSSPAAAQYWAYATLALGLGAGAVHVPALDHGEPVGSSSRNTIRRNAAILPAYCFVLGLLALLGWVAIAAGTKPIGLDGKPNAQLVIPQLFEDSFPAWFAGVAFAAIAIGALVPAAIMSIAAANTFTRNIYKEWLKPDATVAAGGQGLQAHLAGRQGVRAGLRAARSTSRTRSTSSCSAASGSCRPSRPSCSASTPGGSTAGRCSPAGPSAWSTAPWQAYNVVNPATGATTSAARSAQMPGHRPAGLHRADGVRASTWSSPSCSPLVLRAAKVPDGEDETIRGDYFADAGDPRVEKVQQPLHQEAPSV